MAIDFNSPVGKVRLLTADLDEASPLITDDVYLGYLAMNNDSIKRSAADALDAMATSETLLGKKLRTQDVQTDGPAVATDLRKRAYWLRQQADIDDRNEGSTFEIIGVESRAEGAESVMLW